jgi:hypothetical protein
MFERYREFEMISMRPTLGDPSVPLEEKQRLLDELQQAHPSYSWIGATDVNGKVVAAAQGLLAGADVSQRPWFANAFRKQFVGDVHDAKLLASKLSNPSGEPMRFVDVAFPYHDAAGNVAGILGAHINWQWADEVQRTALAKMGAQPGVQTFIVATDGTIILAPKGTLGTTLALKNIGADRDERENVTVERWPDGGNYVWGYSRTNGFQSYPGLGWRVVVRQSADEALAPAKALRDRIIWSGLAVALLCLAFGFAPRGKLSRT